MTDTEWEKFFTLLRKVINLPKKTANEKAAELKSEAEYHNAEGDLEEFVSLAQME